ncbi:alpha/beta hydrolase [Dactylosporangium roseum]|uniref:Alpha/beta hydrolase n=1 Tax=Dactylosporangium roseum TaxID=47989 RepID=A0ABY5ZC63_9ACTN|nr:alpha/beta hydrolase [Dactylosporangium roseum]UWZ39711.1 alpha/beta hydrolase [Dactylosporangium roseum]
MTTVSSPASLGTPPTVAQLLLGCETRIVHGQRWRHRIIEYGTGKPLILLHGSNGHADVFAKNMHTLGQDFRVIAVDALYHGFSSKEPWVSGFYKRLDIQAEGLLDLVDALDLPTVSIEGESMGAGIGLEFAYRWPDRVDKLILSTGFGSVDLEGSVYMRRNVPESELTRLSRVAVTQPSFESMRRRMEWLVASPESVTDELVNLRLRLYALPEIAEMMRRMSEPGDDEPTPKYQESDLAALTVPTLVMWTDKNPGDGPEIGARLASLLPNATLVVIQDAGHWPHWEQPAQHDAIVRDFLLGGPGAVA